MKSTINVGYNPIGIRDFGLFIATVSIFFLDPDRMSLDRLRKRWQ